MLASVVSSVDGKGSDVSPHIKVAVRRLMNVGFVSFSDPDGNRWAVQQISFRG